MFLSKVSALGNELAKEGLILERDLIRLRCDMTYILDHGSASSVFCLYLFIYFFWWGGQLMLRVRRYKVQMPCQVPPITSLRRKKKKAISPEDFSP